MRLITEDQWQAIAKHPKFSCLTPYERRTIGYLFNSRFIVEEAGGTYCEPIQKADLELLEDERFWRLMMTSPIRTMSPLALAWVTLLNPPGVLMMTFSEFQHTVEQILGRPVWTHEFADDEKLIKEVIIVGGTPQ